MKTAFKIFALMLAFIITSCAMYTPPSDIREQFTNCYSGENTGLEQRLNINGVHRIQFIRVYDPENKVRKGSDTLYLDMVFFPDGTFIHGYDWDNYWGVYTF